MSELHNKKNSLKRKSRLNLIDVLLIALVVLAVGIFLSYRFFMAGDNTKVTQITYTVQIEDVGRHLNTEKLIGEELYTESGVCLGKVSQSSDVQTKIDTVSSSEGVVSKQTVYYITVTVSCDAIRMEDNSYRVNGYSLKLGKTLELTSANFELDGICTEVTEVAK